MGKATAAYDMHCIPDPYRPPDVDMPRHHPGCQKAAGSLNITPTIKMKTDHAWEGKG